MNDLLNIIAKVASSNPITNVHTQNISKLLRLKIHLVMILIWTRCEKA